MAAGVGGALGDGGVAGDLVEALGRVTDGVEFDEAVELGGELREHRGLGRRCRRCRGRRGHDLDGSRRHRHDLGGRGRGGGTSLGVGGAGGSASGASPGGGAGGGAWAIANWLEPRASVERANADANLKTFRTLLFLVIIDGSPWDEVTGGLVGEQCDNDMATGNILKGLSTRNGTDSHADTRGPTAAPVATPGATTVARTGGRHFAPYQAMYA